ncbi:hypothetical protein PHMEG_00034932 [Phytophthora megakarya]|uniref:Uncharacterized protein n=1 Tax=Phytophthora megakarya TaxID=4795 RepID=A0A225UQB2_9STRA|nr:hypothetical protein PHMEG_00034932 [Phytophthora megakarya]
MGKCPMEKFYNQIRQWFNPTKHIDVKLGRSSWWNPIRAERSRYCIYAFVNKTSVDQLANDRIYTIIHVICMGNTPSQFQACAKSTSMPDLRSP